MALSRISKSVLPNDMNISVIICTHNPREDYLARR